MLTFAVVGEKKSGKTTAIETLIRGLTKRGYRVATVKHIPKTDFTIDIEGKDTWRHAKAGAQIVVSVAPNELAVVKKIDTTRFTLKEIIGTFEEDVDFVILESFKKLVERDHNVPKIVVVKTNEEVSRSYKRYAPILTFVGPVQPKIARKIPVVDVLKEPEKLVDMTEKAFLNSAENRLRIRKD